MIHSARANILIFVAALQIALDVLACVDVSLAAVPKNIPKGIARSASHRIRKSIAGLPDNEMFCNRELLRFGSRSLVDNVLCRAQQDGLLIRLRSGLYIKTAARSRLPSVDELTQRKMIESDRISCPVSTNRHRFMDATGRHAVAAYYTNGATSSFKVAGGTVLLKNISGARLFREINKSQKWAGLEQSKRQNF